jgi:serine/threonine protein kinase
VIRKTIMKDKLMSETQHAYARRECSIHSHLKHENIVELYDYTESE